MASSDALPQNGLAWTIFTSPVFSSKASVACALFSPGKLELDGAENTRRVFAAMLGEGGAEEYDDSEDSDEESDSRLSEIYGGTTRRLTTLPMRYGLGLKFEGKLKPVVHCPVIIIKTKTAVVSPLRLACDKTVK